MYYLVRFLFCLLLVLPAAAQAQTNDGFLRRDGTMYVLRNGQPRPMPHDVHLPNGRTITHDGFVVEADGRRTELRDGSGCDLNGLPTATVSQAGRVLLQPAAVARRAEEPTVIYMDELPGWARQLAGWRGKGHYKKHKRKKHDDD